MTIIIVFIEFLLLERSREIIIMFLSTLYLHRGLEKTHCDKFPIPTNLGIDSHIFLCGAV